MKIVAESALERTAGIASFLHSLHLIIWLPLTRLFRYIVLPTSGGAHGTGFSRGSEFEPDFANAAMGWRHDRAMQGAFDRRALRGPKEPCTNPAPRHSPNHH